MRWLTFWASTARRHCNRQLPTATVKLTKKTYRVRCSNRHSLLAKPATRLFVVGVAGFEPTASSSRTKRATKLRHTPLEATTAYRTDPAIRQSGLPGQLSGPNGHPPCHLRDSVDTGTAAGATQITPGLAGDLRHSSAWNKRDVGALE
jgi:hypothetical protein